jgi:hypothetical protein
LQEKTSEAITFKKQLQREQQAKTAPTKLKPKVKDSAKKSVLSPFPEVSLSA